MASLEGPVGNLPLELTHSQRRSERCGEYTAAPREHSEAVRKARERTREQQTSTANRCDQLLLPLLQPTELNAAVTVSIGRCARKDKRCAWFAPGASSDPLDDPERAHLQTF